MADTSKLKEIVQPEIVNNFTRKYDCNILNLTKKDLKSIFFNMEPDLVGVSFEGTTLYIGEITTSGYMGQKDRNYHVGAVKKIAEAFTKFYLFNLKDNSNKIIRDLKILYPKLNINVISCHFIIPEGSRFINSIGYREELFRTGIMKLDIIPLSSETHNVIKEVLIISKNEMRK